MREVLKKVYYCDFCKKKSPRSGKDIIRHEKGCTRNPDRVCGLCNRVDVKFYIEKFKRIIKLNTKEIYGFNSTEKRESIFRWIDSLMDGCPNCILTILRCAEFYVADFNYKERYEVWLKENWSDGVGEVVKEYGITFTGKKYICKRPRRCKAKDCIHAKPHKKMNTCMLSCYGKICCKHPGV